MGAGIEAALALFLAVTLPVSTLAPAGQRVPVRIGWWTGVAAMVLSGLSGVLLVVAPASLLDFQPILVLGYPALPWFSWGAVPMVLEIVSALLLLGAYHAMRAPDGPVGMASPV